MEYNSNILRKLNQYFKERWHAHDYRNGWLKMDCPYCGKHKFGVSISTNKANCFSCGDHKNPFKVIMELEDLKTRPEVYNLLKAFEGSDYLEPVLQPREYSTITLPESFKLLSLGSSEMAKMAQNYMEGRRFNIDKLSMKGVGYCTKGDYMGFIIFPFYQQGKLIYFIGRQFIQLGEKFKNPSVEKFGIGKATLTYNIDALAIYNKIYAVESVPNVLTLGDNAIATLGKAVSGYQVSAIIRSPVKEVVIGLDEDARGEAIHLALKLVPYKKVKVLPFPPKKDINDIGRKATKKIEKETPWSTYQTLLKERLKISQTVELPYN